MVARARARLRLRRRGARRDGRAARTPRLRAARARRDARGARRPAARVGAARARPPARRPRLRPGADGRATARAPRATRPPRVALRRPRPGRARAARRARCASAIPGLQIVGGYSPPFRPLTRTRSERGRRRDQRARAPDVVWVGIGAAQAGEVDGAHARPRSTRRCWSASAPRSTSTPASSRRRPRWMQRARARVGLPPRAGAAPPVAPLRCATTRASSPASRASTCAAPPLARRERCACRRSGSRLPERPSTTSRSSASAASGCRWRCSFADRGLRRDRRRQRPRARSTTVARRARCRSRRRGTQELLERVHARRRAVARPSASPTRRGARHIVLTLGTPSLLAHRDRHARHPLGARRPAAACCAPGHSLDPALDVAPGHDRVRRRLPASSSAASRSARTCSSRTRPSGSPRATSSRRSTTLPCIVGGVGERSGEARRPSCSRSSARRSCRRRRCRPSWRRSGRTSCATRTSRCRTC